MSSVSERERNLIIDLALRRISEERFLREFPIERNRASTTALAMLRRAMHFSDPIGVECGLILGFHFGIAPDYLDVLCELAIADWHTRHEDVISGLAELRSPSSVDALYGAALSEHQYRNYDETDSLGRRAIYALESLQTVEATHKLGALLRSGRGNLEREAAERLVDLERSGATSSVRELAARLLASHRGE